MQNNINYIISVIFDSNCCMLSNYDLNFHLNWSFDIEHKPIRSYYFKGNQTIKIFLFSKKGSKEMRKFSTFIIGLFIVLILISSCAPSAPAIREMSFNESTMLAVAMMPIATAYFPGNESPIVTMTNPDSHTAVIAFDYDKLEDNTNFKKGSGAVMTLTFEEDITGLDYRELPTSGNGKIDFDVTLIISSDSEYRFEISGEGPFSEGSDDFLDYGEIKINGEPVKVPESYQ